MDRLSRALLCPNCRFPSWFVVFVKTPQLSAPFAPAAMAELLVRAQGRCKLMSAGFEAFNGHCVFKHKRSGDVDADVITLDDGTAFNFSGPGVQALSVRTHSGIRNVRHQAQSDHEVFSWKDGQPRQLSVRLDNVQNPNVRFEDDDQKADTSSLVGERGCQALRTLTSKGYSYRGGTKLADSTFTYWKQPRTNHCVAVRTTNGRYRSITYTKKGDCS